MSALRRRARIARRCGIALFVSLLSGVAASPFALAQTISTFAGNGSNGFSGDGGPAVAASIYGTTGIVTDAAGNIYFSDANNNRVRKVTPAGVITTIAGGGAGLGEGGPATAAALHYPTGLTFDPSGNLYIAEPLFNRIRKVTPAGTISRR